ncbi:MAG: CHRD domain-containing protein, partial [Candidatus Krumholzibacteriota bacterium]|nr:CHRD domain-containing protein [Candidatus Krumholzibacteriota bacterium]
AHFHNAPAGEEGEIVLVLDPFIIVAEGDVQILGTVQMSDITVDDPLQELLAGTLYINLHTDAFPGVELDASPGAILMGCDQFGPFAVGCRDTLTRLGRVYSGVGTDYCSDDAFAVDPVTQDLYFIYRGQNELRRLPMIDSLIVAGPFETVTGLTTEEVDGARGMVVNDDGGDIFILIDTDNTKSILRITPAGGKTVEVDFF